MVDTVEKLERDRRFCNRMKERHGDGDTVKWL